MELTLQRSRKDGGLLPVSGLDPAQLYPSLVHEIAAACSPKHAQLLATPHDREALWVWTAKGQNVLTLTELSQHQQKELIKAAAAIMADIQAFARQNPTSLTAQIWPAPACFPALSNLFAVEGRPVITQWAMWTPKDGSKGGSPSMPLSPYMPPRDPQKTKIIPPRFPILAATAAFTAGLVAALLTHTFSVPQNVCRIHWPDKNTTLNAIKHKHLNDDLSAQKNNLIQQINTQKQQCSLPTWQPDALQAPPQDPHPLDEPKFDPLPNLDQAVTPEKIAPPKPKPIPQPQPPKEPPQPKPQPQPPKQNVPLPKEAWDKHDKSMLKGCWQLSTRLFYGKRFLLWDNTQPVTNWTMCYDQNGNGYQSLQLANGNSCRSALSASFAGNQLRMHAPSACSGSFNFQPGPNVCTRVSDQEASCVYTNADGSTAHGIFRRR